MTNEAMTEIMIEIVKLMCNNVLLPHQITAQKGKAKEARASIREKVSSSSQINLFFQQYKLDQFFNLFLSQYKLDPTPEPSDEDIESSSDEEDGFGGGKKKEEEDEDPAASNYGDEFQLNVVWKTRNLIPMTHKKSLNVFPLFQRPRRWQRKPRKKLWKWLRANVSYNRN